MWYTIASCNTCFPALSLVLKAIDCTDKQHHLPLAAPCDSPVFAHSPMHLVSSSHRHSKGHNFQSDFQLCGTTLLSADKEKRQES